IPPFEETPRIVDRRREKLEPRSTKPRMVSEHRGGPLGRHPDAADHDAENKRDLPDKESGRRHLLCSDGTWSGVVGASDRAKRAIQKSPLSTLSYALLDLEISLRAYRRSVTPLQP